MSTPSSLVLFLILANCIRRQFLILSPLRYDSNMRIREYGSFIVLLSRFTSQKISNSSMNHSESFLSPLKVFGAAPFIPRVSVSSRRIAVYAARVSGASSSSPALVAKIAAAGSLSKGTFPSKCVISSMSPVGPSGVRGFVPFIVARWYSPAVAMSTPVSFPFPFWDELGSRSAAGSSGRSLLISSSGSSVSFDSRILLSRGLPRAAGGYGRGEFDRSICSGLGLPNLRIGWAKWLLIIGVSWIGDGPIPES